MTRTECAAANVCLFHQDRPAVWNPGHGEAPYCAECKRRWVDYEQVEIEIDLRKCRND
jgi:hypothetical protein